MRNLHVIGCLKTLQIFNVYQFRGGEENTVRFLSEINGPEEWQDVFFHSSDWMAEGKLQKLFQPARGFWNPAAIADVRRRQADWGADVWLFHNVMPVGSLGLYKLAKDEGVPVIQYLHNYRPFSLNGLCYHKGQRFQDGFYGNFLPEILAAGYRNSIPQSAYMAAALTWLRRSEWLDSVRGWISQTQVMKDEFVRGAGIDPDRILVLLPPRRPSPPPRVEAEEDYIFLVSRLVEEKGIRIALRAWQTHFSALGSPRLLIAGEGPLRDEVIRGAEQCPTITYAGAVSNEEKHRLAGGCRAMLAPSIWPEVLGLVTFEAYEAGRPMLAARSGGLVETVKHGETGLLHTPGNPDDLAATVRQLWALSPAERRQMGEAGREWMEKETHPETWKGRYQAFAEKICKL